MDAYLWAPHWDPATNKRVYQVGAACRKCGKEEWSPAPQPGWGRRIFKKRGWHLGNSRNSHTCPDCIAKRRAGRPKEVEVLHVQSEHVDMPPIRREAMNGSVMRTQGCFIETAQESPLEPVNTVLAEKLAPVKAKFEAKARKVKTRGTSSGFSQKSSAAAAARRFLIDKLGVAKPMDNVHYRTVHDPSDGTYSYVLVGTALNLKVPEKAKAALEPKPTPPVVRRPKLRKADGRPAMPPGYKFTSVSAASRSAVAWLRQNKGIKNAQEGVHFTVERDGQKKEQSGKMRSAFTYLLRDPTLPPVAPVVIFKRKSPSTEALLARSKGPGVRLKGASNNARKSATRWLTLKGVADPKEGVHFRVVPMGVGYSSFELIGDPLSTITSAPPEVQAPSESKKAKFKGGQRPSPPGSPKATAQNAHRSAKSWLERYGKPGQGYEIVNLGPYTWTYKLTEPEMTPAPEQPQPQEPEVSDASTQAVRDMEEAATNPSKIVRESTFADKRRIRTALDEFYDEDRGTYRGDWSDRALAEKLDMPRVWVAQVRDTYGPDKNDSERIAAEAQVMAMKQTVTRLNSLTAEAKKIADSVLELAATLETKMAEIKALEGTVDEMLKKVQR